MLKSKRNGQKNAVTSDRDRSIDQILSNIKGAGSSRVHNSLCSFSPFVGYSDSSANLMVIDAQYTRSRKVRSMASLCDPPRLRFFLSRLSSETTCLVYPFNTSLSNRLLHFAVCCSWQYRALSRSSPECLSFSAPTFDEGSIDLRASIVETYSPRAQARSSGLSRS